MLLSWLLESQRSLSGLPASLRWVWLSSPLLRPSHDQPRLKIALALALSRWFPKLTLSTGVTARDCFHTRADPMAEVERKLDGGHRRIGLRFAADLIGNEEDLRAGLAQIGLHCSLLLTQGGEDQVCPPVYAESLFRALAVPDKTFLFAARSRHEPHREPEGDGFISAVRVWLGQRAGD